MLPEAPVVDVLQITHGLFPAALRLNPKMSPAEPVLFATLDIAWRDRQPARAITNIEKALVSFMPRFERHECRGLRAYHVFVGGSRADGIARAREASRGTAGFDASLAFAHLVEHAVIEFGCMITDQVRCSGVTAAHREPEGRYDLLVECLDFQVGRCCLALGIAWLSALAAGHSLGTAERQALAAGRYAYKHPGHGLTAPGLARALGWSESQASRALATLEEVKYLGEIPYTVNFSGVPQFRVSAV